MSKTQKALAMMKETGCTAYAAAKAAGISTPTLYQAIKAKAQGKPRCECCGQVIRKSTSN